MENLTRASEEGLIHGLTRLRETEEYSDLVICCQDRKWNVHRAILCPQSKYFDRACGGSFKEAEDRKIDLDDEDPDMVERLVEDFYTLSYSDNEDPGTALTPASKTADRQAGSLAVNASMYTLGDRYDIPPLKHLARMRFTADLVTKWASGDLLALVDVVYNTTPETDRGLRDCMKEMVREHGRELFEKDDFKDAIKSNGGFALDVVTAAYHGEQPSFQCSRSGCSKRDDSGFRFCQYHSEKVHLYE